MAGIKFKDGRDMKGILCYRVYKDGIPIEEVREENLIVNGARAQMARLIAGDYEGRHITRIAFGVGGDVPLVTDTGLEDSYTKAISGYTFPAIGQVQFDWELGVNECNGKAIAEFGLITEDGTLFSRRVRDNGNPIYKESDISIAGQWIIIF